MTRLRVRIGILGLALLAGLAATPAPSATAAEIPTAEERRLDGAAPQEILRRSGFDTVAPEFVRTLDRAASYAQAERIVRRRVRGCGGGRLTGHRAGVRRAGT